MFALLYASEGAPIGFLWWALPALLRERDVALDAIGSLAATLALPWALKFAWAPLVDVARSRQVSLRVWIVGSQLLMAATLFCAAFVDPVRSLRALKAILVIHAVAAATQDVAIDALAIRTTSPVERGGVNAWMQAGMLSGRAIFGGGSLLLAASVGYEATVATLALIVLASTLLARIYREPCEMAGKSQGWALFGHRLRGVLSRRTTWVGIAFAATAGAAFEAAGVLAGPMLADIGVDNMRIGAFFVLPSVVCMVLGGLLGGRLADRKGPRITIFTAGVIIIVAVVCLGRFADAAAVSRVWSTLVVLYVAIGVFTVASYALFMDLTDRELGSTQFSAFMGATNLCESWAAHVGGRISAVHGYGTAFGSMGLAALCALVLLRGLSPTASSGAA